MESFKDESLADVIVADVSAEQTPEDFDFAAWLEGVRPTRRAVTLYQRADVIAELEALAERIESLPDGPEVDEAVDRFDALKDEFHHGRVFVVEARSPEWVEHFQAEARKALGVKGEPTQAQDARVLFEQLAAQIVTPRVDADQLERLQNVNAGEFNKLAAALGFANRQVAQSAGVLKLDFTSRRSAKRGTRR